MKTEHKKTAIGTGLVVTVVVVVVLIAAAGYFIFYPSTSTTSMSTTSTSTTSSSTTSSSTTSKTTSSSSTTSSSTTTTSSSTTSSSTSTSSSAATLVIYLPSGIGSNTGLKVENSAGGAFTTATVAPGTTVMFINNDTTNIHNIHFTVVPSGVTLAVNPSPNTNLWTLAKTGFPSNTFSFTLTTAGTYTFFCDYHDWMTGTITVT